MAVNIWTLCMYTAVKETNVEAILAALNEGNFLGKNFNF